MRALPGKEQREPSGKAHLSRVDNAAEQRSRILRVTADLIAKRGYTDTATDLIVRRAKVGYGTFYKFFPDKEAAFLALFDETFETYSVRVATAFGDVDDSRPWADRVAAAIGTFYATIAADPPLWKACLVEALTAGPEALERYEEATQQLGQILRAGRRESKDAHLQPASLEGTLAGAQDLDRVSAPPGRRGAEKLPGLLPEAVQFASTPYLGEHAAIKVAKANAGLAAVS